MLLKEKVAVITGGSSGIGKAVAKALAQEGAKIALLDIKEAGIGNELAELINEGKSAIYIKTDITDQDSVRNAIKTVAEQYGKIDILVNCAGILHTKPIEDITVADWDKIMNVNLKGTFIVNQCVLPYLRKQRFGRIINIASNSGRDGGVSCGLDYATSKAGVIGFTRGLARRVASEGITCNCIAPGTTSSDMLESFSEEQLKKAMSSIPVGKFGKPEHIAALACFVASDAAEFMTGAVLDINGGMFIG